MRGDEVTVAVQRAAEALGRAGIDYDREAVRDALAAVLPEIQAQALRDAAEAIPGSTADYPVVDPFDRAAEWLCERAARLTATSEPAEAYQTCTGCRAQTLGECLCAETEEPTDV